MGESLANLSIWEKKVWRINKSANRLLILSTNLDGAKFAKRSPHQTLPLYGSMVHSIASVHNAKSSDITSQVHYPTRTC